MITSSLRLLSRAPLMLLDKHTPAGCIATSLVCIKGACYDVKATGVHVVLLTMPYHSDGWPAGECAHGAARADQMLSASQKSLILQIQNAPDDDSKQSSAPSSAIIFSSTTRTVGLPYRPYSKLLCLPSW